MKSGLRSVFVLLVALACTREEPAREAALADDLSQMRQAIDAYHQKTGHYPQRLNDLVPQFLRRIPKDPVTRKADWRVITEEPVAQNDFGVGTPAPRGGGIVDVRSSAAGHDRNGKSWSDY